MSDRHMDLATLFPGLDLTEARPSPFPWSAETGAPTPSGAVLILDARDDVVGWATDIAGHTSEGVPPDGRTPSQIARNATLLAMAPRMAAVLRLIAAGAPELLTLLDRPDVEAPHGMRAALRGAMAVDGELGA